MAESLLLTTETHGESQPLMQAMSPWNMLSYATNLHLIATPAPSPAA